MVLKNDRDKIFNELTPNDALLWSIKNYYPDYIKKAIERGANINLKENTYNWTALMEASYYGNLNLVKFLVENGANVNIKNQHGHTAICRASLTNKIEVVKYLKENGAKKNIFY